jgi:hypothetical protein
MTKKVFLTVGAFLLPFILVWTAWICTGGIVSPFETFSSGMFWGLSIIYWMFPVWFMLEAIWEFK